MRRKLIDLQKIEAYKENVIPFLEYQRNQLKESDLKEEKKFLENKVERKLNAEKKRISEFIPETETD